MTDCIDYLTEMQAQYLVSIWRKALIQLIERQDNE
jgi:hypothetical protein